MIKKVISGGQVGAGQAALDAAIKLGIAHGGWIQKGRKTQGGILPEKYKLTEMPTASYKLRIEQNVIDSDGTLIISHGKPTGGADYSREMALKHKRQLLHIDLAQMKTLQAARMINAWLALRHIETLNVAGSRSSEDAQIYKTTMDILESAYYLNQVENKTQPLDALHKNLTKTKLPDFENCPKTVDESVDHLIVKMPLKDRTLMASLQKEELSPLSLSLGLYIRNQLLQNGANADLLASCRAVGGDSHLSEDRAAFVIIEQLWKRLQKTHRLRVVK